ncbi:hypothetical protein ACFRAQ_36290 [Nocardia sp. NPDC056611]|uniref:hypothetical protein n=1 Tax=Nocardia sp. NPDC056611 TaxID=3345877 RepID=UPI00366BFE2A
MSTLTERSRQQKLYLWRRANGVEVYTDPAPVRAHIETLMGWGMTLEMIRQGADCSGQAVRFIVDGTFPRVKAELAQRLLQVDHRPGPSQWFALAVGARRRVEALNTMGWQSQYLAERLGIYDRVKLQSMIKQPRIRYTTWLAINELYEELSASIGPGNNTMVRARNRGLASPLAWYDIDIDHPAAIPSRTAQRSHCKDGHALSPDNILVSSTGHQQCRECHRIRNRASRRRAMPGDVAEGSRGSQGARTPDLVV